VIKFFLAAGLLFQFLGAYSQLTYETLFVDYDSAWQYKNLKVIPIRPRQGFGGPLPNIISLSQAIQQGLATVSERGTASTENVHFLRINNRSNKSLYISSGEIMSGGRQDRIMARDTILDPSEKDQYVPVMCVEEGRWSEKEKKFDYGNFGNLHLRQVLDQNKNQVLIWKEIGNQLSTGQISNKTLAYMSRYKDKKFSFPYDEYFKWFQDKFRRADSTMVGIVCVSGNKVIGSDIFSARNLFYNQLEPLLRGYIDEAIMFGSSVTLPNDKVKEYMDKLLTNERSQEEFVKYNGKIFRQGNRIIHINTF